MSTVVNSVNTGVSKENHVYHWKIQNFAMVQKNAELVAKQKFEINTGPKSAVHSFWTVGLKMSSTGTHIGFYCNLVGLQGVEGSEVPMGFSIDAKYRDGNHARKSLLKTLKSGESCGFENVWTFDWPDWDRYTDGDGSLTISTTLSIFVPISPTRKTEAAFETFKTTSVAKLQENLGSLVPKGSEEKSDNAEEGEFTGDVKIISTDGKEFRCHKLLLSIRSPYFDTLFRSGFSETSTGTIKMDDLSGKTIEVLLHYIYTGQLLDSWLEPDVIVEFTYAAGKYQFMEILELLDNLLGTAHEQTSQTSVVLLELANKLSLKKAEAELMERIVKFTVSAENSEEFLSLIGNQ